MRRSLSVCLVACLAVIGLGCGGSSADDGGTDAAGGSGGNGGTGGGSGGNGGMGGGGSGGMGGGSGGMGGGGTGGGDAGGTGGDAGGDVVPAPAYFMPGTTPAGLRAPAGLTVSTLRATEALISTAGTMSGVFWKDGRLHAFSAVKTGPTGLLVHVLPGEKGTLFAEAAVLKGAGWKHGAAHGANVLVSLDYIPEQGADTMGLVEVEPGGKNHVWSLKESHAGTCDVVANPTTGYVFADFENDNVWQMTTEGATESKLVTSDTIAGATFLAWDPAGTTLYVANRGSAWSWPFGGDDAIYTVAGGKLTLVAKAPSGGRFEGLAFGQGGTLGGDLYASESSGGQVVRVEKDGKLTPVVTGLTTIGEVRIDPKSKGMAIVAGAGKDLVFLMP